MQRPPGLDDLLRTLRASGLNIGQREILRIHHVLSSSPLLSLDELRTILRCAVVRTVQERDTFSQIFESWKQRYDGLSNPQEATVSDEPELPPGERYADDWYPVTEPPRRRRSHALFLSILSVAIFVLGTVVWISNQEDPDSTLQPNVVDAPPVDSKDPRQEETPPPRKESLLKNEIPSSARRQITTFTRYSPVYSEIPGPRFINWWQALLGTIAGSCAGLGIVFLRRRFQAISGPPLPPPPPDPNGPRYLPPTPLSPSSASLLSEDVEREMIWSVERFTSDELTDTIDVHETVKHTASSGGFPEIRFERQQYAREVWLWIDEATLSPTVESWARSLRSSLERAGLAVRLGWFYQVPDRVVYEDDDVVSPLVLEGHRQSSLVAILTDGRGLSKSLDSNLHRTQTRQLLRQLEEWPRLTLVDFSRGRAPVWSRSPLDRLPRILPEDLPRWLGGEAGRTDPRGARLLVPPGELRAWAAACSLSHEAVSADRALALRKELSLDVPSTAWSHLLRLPEVEADQGRATFTQEQRVQLQNWLAEAESTESAGEPDSTGLIQRSIRFWKTRLEAQRKRRIEESTETLPYENSEASLRDQQELAMLDLWIDPEKAVLPLSSLHDGPFGKEVRARLEQFAVRDSHEEQKDGRIVLPWSESLLSVRTRWLLRRIGLKVREGGEANPLRMTQGLLATLGILGGVALVAGITVFRSFVSFVSFEGSETPIVVRADKERFVAARIGVDNASDDIWLVTGEPTERNLAAGPILKRPQAQLTDWTTETVPNPEDLGNGVLLWRAGTLTNPRRFRSQEDLDKHRRYLFVIGEDIVRVDVEPTGGEARPDPDDSPRADAPYYLRSSAKDLTFELLDRGIADAVLTGRSFESHLKALIGTSSFHQQASVDDQLVILVPEDLPEPSIQFVGSWRVYKIVSRGSFLDSAIALSKVEAKYPKIDEVWPGLLEPLRGNTFDLVIPLRPTVWIETIQVSGSGKEPIPVEFAHIPGDTFLMGDEDEEKISVSVAPIAVGVTEVNRAMYRQLMDAPSDWDRENDDRLPASSVSWWDTLEFCNRLSDEQNLDPCYAINSESVTWLPGKNGYRLPTESEWEYVARAGTNTRWFHGDGNSEEGIDNYAWYGKILGEGPFLVGDLAPNRFRLKDILGNVWEWCWDRFEGGKGVVELEETQVRRKSAGQRVLRGGSYLNSAQDVRPANRFRYVPEDGSRFFGFRVVRSVARQP